MNPENMIPIVPNHGICEVHCFQVCPVCWSTPLECWRRKRGTGCFPPATPLFRREFLRRNLVRRLWHQEEEPPRCGGGSKQKAPRHMRNAFLLRQRIALPHDTCKECNSVWESVLIVCACWRTRFWTWSCLDRVEEFPEPYLCFVVNDSQDSRDCFEASPLKCPLDRETSRMLLGSFIFTLDVCNKLSHADACFLNILELTFAGRQAC